MKSLGLFSSMTLMTLFFLWTPMKRRWWCTAKHEGIQHPHTGVTSSSASAVALLLLIITNLLSWCVSVGIWIALKSMQRQIIATASSTEASLSTMQAWSAILGCTSVKRRTASEPSSVEKPFYNLHVSRDKVKQIIILKLLCPFFCLKTRKRRLIKPDRDCFTSWCISVTPLLVILSKPAFIKKKTKAACSGGLNRWHTPSSH